jgi:GH18 family chitinase
MSDITRKNAVYYPNYRVYRGETPATLNYSCIDHVFYAFAQVNEDGEVVVRPARPSFVTQVNLNTSWRMSGRTQKCQWTEPLDV